MKNIHIALFFWLVCCFFCCQPKEDDLKITEYVDPFALSLDNSPEAVVPFGAIRLGAETENNHIRALALHHSTENQGQSSHTLRFLPITTQPTGNVLPRIYAESNVASYSKEQAKPGYYAVCLDNGINIEAAVTEHCGIMYYQYPKDSQHALLINLLPFSPQDSVQTRIWKINQRTLEGYCKKLHNGNEQQLYFVIEFSQDCKALIGEQTFETLDDDREFIAKGCCIWLDFGKRTDQILVKASLSTVNTEGAAANLEKELSHWSFDKVERDAKQAWKRELQKVKVEGKDKNLLKTFYTDLYQAYMTPAIFSDVNGNYKGPDGEIHSAHKYTHYAVSPPWNEWEDISPLLSITQKKRVRDMLKSSQNDLRFFVPADTLPQPNDTIAHKLLTSMGIAPIEPYGNRYQLVVPSFDRVVIHLGQEKRFVITVEKESDADVYIEEVWLNKRKLDRLWITDDEIMLGGKLNFVLTNE